MTLTPAFLDELRARTHLSALIGRTTKLQKAGREMRGCCPFHQEKTPSFYVNDDKGFYHCFGCSAHGDAIRWMTDQRGLPFIDAVKELAQAAGLDMPAQDRQSAERAERAKDLHDVCQAASDWFEAQLAGADGGAARALLGKRGITDETRRRFALGYAPDSRGKLRAALREYGDAMLVEAGLLIQVEGKEPYDRFRGRLVIPIRDPRGRVIAFGARIVGEGEPKYLNSPDTPLFDKGRTLYNLDRAAPAARKAGRVIVVEGYLDVIALAQAGVEEAVAPLGTALTEAQLERLWRVHDVPILCLDGDAAGQKAAIRAGARALPMLAPGKSLSFVRLPLGQDPDDVVREGVQLFEAYISRKVGLDEQLWNAELASARIESPDGRALFKHRLGGLASQIANKDLQAEYRRTFFKRFFDLFGIGRQKATAINEAVAQANRHPRRGLEYALQRAILLGLMRHPSVIASTMEDLMRLRFVDRYLTDWRDHLLEAASDIRELTESIVDQIIDQTDVSPIELRCYSKDLAFSFYRRSSSAEEATADLKKVIEVVVDEQENSTALKLAIKAFNEDMTEARFQEQVEYQKAVVEAGTRLADWLEQARDAA